MNAQQFYRTICLSITLAVSVIFTAASQEMIMNENDTIIFNVQPDSIEFEILKEFYQATGGKKWTNDQNWLKGRTSNDFATWFGVVVEDGDVSEIHLDNNNLKGEIPKSIYNLDRLTVLSVEGNRFKKQKDKTKDLTPESLSALQEESFSTFSTLAAPVEGGKNLPVWGLAVEGTAAQKIDWRISPSAELLPNSGTNKIGSTAVALDACGRLAFYVLHSGVDNPYQLNLYAEDGTKLTDDIMGSSKQALSSVIGSNEIQVVRVPNVADEWYIIYSLWYGRCIWSPTSSIYCPAKVVYARVKYNRVTKELIIPRDKRQISISSNTFIQGKAVSRTVNGDESRHYLYLAQRENSGVDMNFTRIHRYIIDETGINFGSQSGVKIPAGYWIGTIGGSCLELSPDEKWLAMTNRNVGSWIKEDIILFDLTQFSSTTYSPKLISVPSLKLYGTGTTIKELFNNNPAFYCYRYLKNKLAIIEFSPSGRYLYVTHGGYPDGTGGIAYNTYLLQIDLQSSAGADFEVRARVQRGDGVVSGRCTGTRSSTFTKDFIQMIQTAYDGKLYFTKSHSNTLFVIPNPDDPLPQDLTPGTVSLANATSPNIQMQNNAKVVFMPENIDGYNYLKSSPVTAPDFTFDKNPLTKGQTVILTIAGFSATNSYQIAWGDGKVEQVTTASISHQYLEKGEFPVTLTFRQGDGCAAYRSKTLSVIDCGETLGWVIDTKQYLCATEFSVPKLGDCFATYLWNFGDGTTSRNRRPLHVYAGNGSYTVSVKISFNCDACRGDITKTKTITVNKSLGVVENVTINVPSQRKTNIISSGCTTFSNSWTLDHNEPALENLDHFTSGALGVWRSEGLFVYNETRKASTPIDLKQDGTYTLDHFNWPYAQYEAIPKWIKSNSITRYNSSSYEIENKDVLGIYSSALYDYRGELQSAQGVNMNNQEMAFTGFEGPQEFPAGSGTFTFLKPTGNFIFSNQAFPAYKSYKIISGHSYMATIEVPFSEIQSADKADIVTNTFTSFFVGWADRNYMRDVKILCKQAHPTNPNWSVLVFEREPLFGLWSGEIRIRNIVSLAVRGDVDKTVAHTGKSSLKITAEKTFEQKLLKLEAGKTYHLNVWVKDNSVATQPRLGNNLGVDVILKNSVASVVATFLIVPDGPIIEGWQQVRGSFTCPENNLTMSLKFKPGSTGTAWYDDARFHPETGNMKSYVYDTDDFRLRAILDEQNFASIFFYDKEGNLYLTKKETEDGIKTVAENISYLIER